MDNTQAINQTEELTKTKQYSTRAQVAITTFLGGPLAGCYLIGKNYKTMGDIKRGKQWLLGGIISTVIMLALVLLLPEKFLNMIPHSLIPIAYTGTIDYLFTQLQGKHVKQQLADGVVKYSWWKCIGIAAAALALYFVVVMILMMLFPWLQAS